VVAAIEFMRGQQGQNVIQGRKSRCYDRTIDGIHDDTQRTTRKFDGCRFELQR
jgi:hypothetical protein